MPIPDRRIFHIKDMHPRYLWGIRPSFPGLSPCPGQVAYVLLTSAPVAARSIATSALPLDLHVLSLSLAFILSQDQTLRCCMIVSSFTRIKMKTQRRLSACPRPACPCQGRLGSAVLVFTLPVFRNLDVDSAVSLPCLCTVNFPHCKHFNDLSCPPATLRTRRQKKPLTDFTHPVSRKAMQNYSRHANRPNKNRIIFRK